MTMSEQKYLQKELFLDDFQIEAAEHLTRKLHQPTLATENPILQPDKPWEGWITAPTSVIYDTLQEKFRMWYMGFPGYMGKDSCGYRIPTYTVCYAESKDGFQWDKPILNKAEFQGDKANNLAIQGWDLPVAQGVVFMPEHHVPMKRYRLYVWDGIGTGKPFGINGMCLYCSDDGFNWGCYEWPSDGGGDPNSIVPGDERKRTSESEVNFRDPQPPIWNKMIGEYRWPYNIGPNECNMVLFDEKIGTFVNYCRCQNGSVRVLGRMESNDGINWTRPELILMPDLEDGFRTQFYDCAAVRTGEHVILLTQMYHMDRTQIDIQLLAGRDGKNFSRVVNREVFMPLGAEGSFKGGMLQPAPPVEHAGKLWIYTGCSPFPHQYEPEEDNIRKMYLYQLRQDGYVSFRAGDKEGRMATRKMDWLFDEIHINGRCDKDGYIIVELYDGDASGWAYDGGITFEDVYKHDWRMPDFLKDDCITFTGDSLDHRITFRHATVGQLMGRYVQIHFYLKNAELFSYSLISNKAILP